MFDSEILEQKQIDDNIEKTMEMTLVNLQLLYELFKEKESYTVKKKQLIAAMSNLIEVIESCEK